jgi:hypothetical protein
MQDRTPLSRALIDYFTSSARPVLRARSGGYHTIYHSAHQRLCLWVQSSVHRDSARTPRESEREARLPRRHGSDQAGMPNLCGPRTACVACLLGAWRSVIGDSTTQAERIWRAMRWLAPTLAEMGLYGHGALATMRRGESRASHAIHEWRSITSSWIMSASQPNIEPTDGRVLPKSPCTNSLM